MRYSCLMHNNVVNLLQNTCYNMNSMSICAMPQVKTSPYNSTDNHFYDVLSF